MKWGELPWGKWLARGRQAAGRYKFVLLVFALGLLLLLLPGGGEEPLVLPGGELPGLIPAELSLDGQPSEAAVRPAQKGEEAVQGGDRPVGPGGRPGGGQMLPVGGGFRRRQLPVPQPEEEGLRLPAVLHRRGGPPALGFQCGGKGRELFRGSV